jgi:hypothetical protein
VVLVPFLAFLLLTGFRVLKADDRRSWMVPGRVVLGLSKDRSQIDRPEALATPGQNRWTAGVAESNWEYVVLHHSASESGSVQSIHEEHRRRKDAMGNAWLGIGYHFVIGNGQGMKDGAVEPTFRWKEQLHGAHSGDALFNARGIGICLIGNFEKTPPSKAQLAAVKELIRTLAGRHQIVREKIIGHASVKATACPGKHFPLQDVRAVVP